MKTIYDVQQFLKQYGVFIYVGNRVADLELMEMELREIYKSQLMDTKDYQMAILLLHHEIQILKDKEKNKNV